MCVPCGVTWREPRENEYWIDGRSYTSKAAYEEQLATQIKYGTLREQRDYSFDITSI